MSIFQRSLCRNTGQRLFERFHLFVRPDRDAHKVLYARRGEMADQDARLLHPLVDVPAAHTRFAGKDEIRQAVDDGEALPAQEVGERLSFGGDLPCSLGIVACRPAGGGCHRLCDEVDGEVVE